MKQHELKPGIKRKRAKRLGRGDASGRGSYSTKGMKGQKARSGVGGLKKLGMRHIILSTPKLRGFRSIHPKAEIVKLNRLDKYFKDGDTITPKVLLEKNIIRGFGDVKILSGGKLTKKIIVSGCKISKSAKNAIEAAGGKAE